MTGELEVTNQWYAIAKISGIKLCEALRRQHGFGAISLMPTNLYGPGDNYHPTNSTFCLLIRRFHEAVKTNTKSVTCWGTGTPRRDSYVDDLADACIYVLKNWSPTKNEPSFLNVGTGKDISIKELVQLVADISKYRGDVLWDKSKPDGTYKKQLDVSRINSLGWKSRISLIDGIQSTYSCFNQELLNNTLRS